MDMDKGSIFQTCLTLPSAELVTLESRLFEIVVPCWLKDRTLGDDPETGLHLWYQHGVLVLRVDDNWGPDPTAPLEGGERLLVGFTSEAISLTVCCPSTAKKNDWLSVDHWLHHSLKSRWHYQKNGPVPLVGIAHQALEQKQLAAIGLHERFGFSPKIMGILRADGGPAAKAVDWFPGGSDCVRPGDTLLCHADVIDVQLLQARLDLAFDQERRDSLRTKLEQVRSDCNQTSPRHCRSSMCRSVSPITLPRLRKRSRSRRQHKATCSRRRHHRFTVVVDA
jgi:hypothetical protein